MKLDEISQELKDRARACKTLEEVQALAKSEGIELGGDELDQIAGGVWDDENCSDYYRRIKCREVGW